MQNKEKRKPFELSLHSVQNQSQRESNSWEKHGLNFEHTKSLHNNLVEANNDGLPKRGNHNQ
jgi:hypothetical protein